MGSRYKEEKPFAFYDPEQDRDGQRQAPRSRPGPLSPRAPLSPRGAPLSPRAQPSGQAYPMSTSPRDLPFGHYDPELDRERDRHGASPGPELRGSQSGLDSRSLGRGAPPPPYIKQDTGILPREGRGAPEPGYGGRGAPESGYEGRGAPGLGYAGRGAPEPGYGGRRAPEHGYGGRGGPEPGYGGRGAPEPGYGGRGAADPGYGGRGAPEHGYGGRGAPEPGYGGRGAPEPGYGGRGAPEPGYGGRGAFPPPPNQDFAGVSGRGRGYGDGESGYPRPGRPAHMEDDLDYGASMGRGRGSSVGPLGAGKYIYGGLQLPERADFDGAPPPPISSEYAHQVYASVFSDPVYGGAGQLNAKAGYAEEPQDLQQLHHKQDVLRHPDMF